MFFEKTKESLRVTNGPQLNIQFKLIVVQVQFSSESIKETLLLAKDITNNVIFGITFIAKLFPYFKM